MTQLTASILINNYNYGRFLGEAIDSALAQTYPGTDVVVVDDGSTDDSRDVIARYGERIRAVLKPNGGQASAFNAGFAASSGDVLCLLDADDLAAPQRVRRVVEAFEAHPSAGWCFHPLKLLGARPSPDCRVPPPEGLLDLRESVCRGVIPAFAPATSGLCFRRSLLGRILPMPEAQGVCLNDIYLKCTAFALGAGCCLNDPLSVLRVHDGNAYSYRDEGDPKAARMHARVHVLTGYWTARRFPQMSRLSDKFMGMGMGIYGRIGTVDEQYQPYIDEYLDSVGRVRRDVIRLRAFYHRSPLFAAVRRRRVSKAANEV